MTRLAPLACHALTGAAGLSAIVWAAMPGHHPGHVLTLLGVAIFAGYVRLFLEEPVEYPQCAAVARMAAASQNWTVSKLAEVAGVSRDSLSSAHSGRRPLPPGFEAWLLQKTDIELEALGLRRHNILAAQAERRREVSNG